MPKERPIEAKTRRGNRVYRSHHKVGAETRYAHSYSFRIKKDGEHHRLNLGADLDEAKKMADQIDAFLAVPSHSFDDLFDHADFKDLKKPRRYSRRKPAPESAPLPKHIPTVGEILDRYQECANHLSPTTIVNNSNALRHLAAETLGLRPIPRRATKAKRARWRKKVHGVSIADMTLPALESIRAWVLRRAGSDGLERGRAATTLNTYFRAARSVFAERVMPFYEDFELPDPNPFCQIKALREPSRRYVSKIDLGEVVSAARRRFWDGELDDHAKAELERAKAAQAENPRRASTKTQEDRVREDKARFIVLLLTLACGLRPKEIMHLTWDQIDFEEGRINVAVTSYDTPKAKSSEGYVDVSEPVLDYLRKFRPHSVLPPFVIPAPRRRGHSPRKPGQDLTKPLFAWLRRNGVSGAWPLYTFRKEAGSLVFQKTQSFDAAAEFLRNDPRVAREHYVGRKSRLEVEVPGLESAA